MKKVCILIIMLLCFCGCKGKDNLLFKEEYEKLNKDKNYHEVNISKDNPMQYIKASKLVKKIEKKEDMVVYFGYAKCNWCRSIIESLLEVCKDLDIKEVYYLDIEEIRDIKKVENKEIITSQEGSKEYQKLLELLDGHLKDYSVNNQVVGKRIYAPNILVIKDKEILDVINGISDLQTIENQEITSEIKKDSYDKIKKYLERYATNTCKLTEGC